LFTLMRGGKARKSLAIFNGVLLKKVIKARKLIFKLRLPQYIACHVEKRGEYKRHSFSSLLTNLTADLESIHVK
jgi:hypothetical protein